MMRERIETILKQIIPGDGPASPTHQGEPVHVTVPENSEQGHYSTNAAFALAKTEKKSPMEVAEKIAAEIIAKGKGFIESAEAAKPGFVNIRLTQETLVGELRTILEEKEKYGAAKAGKRKVQIEFISANPTGPLTLANGRGGFLGDVIANVFAFSGIAVEREYYVNDTGNQVLTLGKSICAAAGHIPDDETFYKGEYILEWAKRHADFVGEHKDNAEAVGEKAASDFLGLIQNTIEQKSGIRFDRYTSEKNDIHKKGFPDKALSVFKKERAVYESEGAVWLKTSEYGDDKDRVLITGEKAPTYFLADAGHYLETKERGFTGKINILGPDHYGYVARIQAAAKLLGLADSRVLITQAVRLMKNGEEMKMSKRKGAFVTFEELVEEVGADVARFFFLMIAPETHMDFDLTLAKEHSMKNPVYYVQYAYVRAKGIRTKTEVSAEKPDWKLLNTEDDSALIRILAEFPEAVADTAQDLQVHRLTRYAMHLARVFNGFYEREHVAGEEPALAAARLALVDASVQVFENLFKLLGISRPDKM